jgi:hypothetical protein
MENKAFIGVDLRSSAAFKEFFRILLDWRAVGRPSILILQSC